MARFDGLTIWTDDFIADTLDLDAEEIGAYFLLLMAAWRSPTCDLPDDNRSLARFARCAPRRWSCHMRDRMLQFWTVANGRWTQGRLLRERDATENRKVKAVQAAHLRWDKTKNSPNENSPEETANSLTSLQESDANASAEHVASMGPSICLGDASGLGLDIKKDIVRKTPKPNEPPAGFSKWYAAYPRKEARLKAEEAYAKALLRGATEAELIEGLRRFRWNPDTKFIPMPASWLNQGRWQDEPAKAPPQRSTLVGGL